MGKDKGQRDRGPRAAPGPCDASPVDLEKAAEVASDLVERLDALSWAARGYLQVGDRDGALRCCGAILDEVPDHTEAVAIARETGKAMGGPATQAEAVANRTGACRAVESTGVAEGGDLELGGVIDQQRTLQDEENRRSVGALAAKSGATVDERPKGHRSRRCGTVPSDDGDVAVSFTPSGRLVLTTPRDIGVANDEPVELPLTPYPFEAALKAVRRMVAGAFLAAGRAAWRAVGGFRSWLVVLSVRAGFAVGRLRRAKRPVHLFVRVDAATPLPIRGVSRDGDQPLPPASGGGIGGRPG
jgi:hypothetical protein